tara:strand:+ start:736 stop:1197 length:462 start_codon:yes stop_codon:yes gene_type:complete
MRKLLVIAVIGATVTAATAGCAPRFANRGNIPAPSQLEKLQVGKHSKEYVRTLLGTPSTVGTFDKEVWYYIGRRTEKWAFFDETVIQQKVVVVYFDPTGKVEYIQKYDQDDGRKVNLVEGKTPTSGRKLGILEQIMGNLGRFNRPSSSSTHRY